jgi:hypothetical protein
VTYFVTLSYPYFLKIIWAKIAIPNISLKEMEISSLNVARSTYEQGNVKAILVIGGGGPQVCETSRLPHLLDSWLIDGGEVVSLTRRTHFYPQENSWYSFLLEAESTPWSYCGWKVD